MALTKAHKNNKPTDTAFRTLHSKVHKLIPHGHLSMNITWQTEDQY